MTTGDTPITQSGISPPVSLVSRDAQLSQVGHLCFGLLPLLPDIHCLHRRRFSAWPSRLSCSEDAAGWSACDRHSSTPSAFLTQAVLHSFSRLLLAVLQNNTPGQLHKCKLSGRVLRSLSGQTHHRCAQVIPVEDKRRRLNRWLGK